MANQQYESMQAVRRILFEEWDPLDVGDNTNLRDEYDDCVPQVIEKLRTGASEQELNALLSDMEERLGVKRPNSRRDETVRALLGLKLR